MPILVSALGFVGLAMMGLQFALIARFKTWRRRSGSTP
jgi:hypothetical protein